MSIIKNNVDVLCAGVIQARKCRPRLPWSTASCWWTSTTPRTTSRWRTRWCPSPARASQWSETTCAITTTEPSWMGSPSTPGTRGGHHGFKHTTMKPGTPLIMDLNTPLWILTCIGKERPAVLYFAWVRCQNPAPNILIPHEMHLHESLLNKKVT